MGTYEETAYVVALTDGRKLDSFAAVNEAV